MKMDEVTCPRCQEPISPKEMTIICLPLMHVAMFEWEAERAWVYDWLVEPALRKS